METCELCNNMLPRTVDQCPVCGEPVTRERARPEFEPPVAPGWASSDAPLPPRPEDPFAASPAWAPAGEPLPPPGTEPDPGSLDHPATPPSYQPPSTMGSAYGAPGFANPDIPRPDTAPPPPPAADTFDPRDAIASPDGFSEPESDPVRDLYDSPGYVPGLEDGGSPQRVGHDGQPVGAALNPITEAPTAALAEASEQTRTVQAFSSRIEGDIKYGRSPKHGLITAGLAALAVAAFGLGAGAGVLAASASDSVQSFEPTEAVVPEAEIDLMAFHETHGDNLVQIQLNGCGVRASGYGVAADEATVLVPWSFVKTDKTPTIIAADGSRINGEVIGWRSTSGLAVVRLTEPLASGGFGWSGANQATAGTELVLIHPDGDPAHSRSIVSHGMTRNNDGIPDTIKIAEDETLEPGSFALTEDGLLAGAVNRSGSTLISADVLRAFIGALKVDPEFPDQICPAPPEPEPTAEDGDTDGEAGSQDGPAASEGG